LSRYLLDLARLGKLSHYSDRRAHAGLLAASRLTPNFVEKPTGADRVLVRRALLNFNSCDGYRVGKVRLELRAVEMVRGVMWHGRDRQAALPLQADRPETDSVPPLNRCVV
jgi:hypothetical protein